MPDPVQHDLGDRPLAVRRPGCRPRNRLRWLGIERLRARAGLSPLKTNGFAAGLGPEAIGICGIDLERLFGRESADQHRRRRGRSDRRLYVRL